MMLVYNILFPVAFLFFVPGMLWKLIRRSGHKETYWERFGLFSAERRRDLTERRGCVWIHAVSVGETVVALSLIRSLLKRDPERSIVLSTTTTTGQNLARRDAPEGVEVIFCPIDFLPFVKRVVSMLRPSTLVIFETEIWPNIIREVGRAGGTVSLVNARMSDRSYRGYFRFRCFFRPILEWFDHICVQSALDAERFRSIAPNADVRVCGNMKFDQELPENLSDIDLSECFDSDGVVILGASTHPGEERLIAEQFFVLRVDHPGLRLILVPRHAERGAEIAAVLENMGVSFHRRSLGGHPEQPVDCLLADTTGEMLSFMSASDVVIMGKSLAGHDEGHNLIEPALLAKPIITGATLTNFRETLDILRDADGLIPVKDKKELREALDRLIADASLRMELGKKAKDAIVSHKGATDATLRILLEGTDKRAK